jgi:hypothetical protein
VGRGGGIEVTSWRSTVSVFVEGGGGSGGREPPETGAEGSWMMWWGHDMENMLIGEQLRRSS